MRISYCLFAAACNCRHSLKSPKRQRPCDWLFAYSHPGRWGNKSEPITLTCTAKTFNECLMEAPCSAWKRLGPNGYQLNTKIIFRGNPVEGETISGGTMGEMLETKCGKK